MNGPIRGLAHNARHRDDALLTTWIRNGRSGGKPIHENHDGDQLRYNCNRWVWEAFDRDGRRLDDRGGWRALHAAKDDVERIAADRAAGEGPQA